MINRPITAVGKRRLSFELPVIVVVVGILAAISGCNDGKAMGRVRGKVFFKDGSVPHGGVCVVSLLPAEGTTAVVKKGASSAIEPDGSFDMMTRQPGDGAYYGDYVVTFTIVKGPMDPTSLILPKYSSKTDTPYKLKVDGNKEDLRYEVEALPAAGAGAADGAKPAGK
jgi:hypothetical protein